MADKHWSLEDVRRVIKENDSELKAFLEKTYVPVREYNDNNTSTAKESQELKDKIHEVDRKHFKWYMSLYVVVAITLIIMFMGFILVSSLNSWALFIYTNPKLQLLIENAPKMLNMAAKYS